MYLKRLTINGFKSFADKLSIHFDRGITGIVGPNGSGKSNVIDAVRWVMGEQNARFLRGEKATDIIFAGSDKRKPLSVAEVALTFDNTEDDGLCPPEFRHDPEITISRRLYMDGEREYFMNKKECRLKDIVQFFALTGLGGRSYSMIQQGQVDRILNAKPEDVREILEEAAGTLIYKQRKLEAQKKLEETHLNLSRVDDILQEVEKQREALESQVEKAQAWKNLSDLLRIEELAFFAHNVHFFQSKLKEIDDLIAEKQASEADALAKLAHFEVRYEELQNILVAADPELQVLGEELTRVREAIARAESTIEASHAYFKSGEERLSSIKREIDEERAHVESLEREQAGAQSQLVRIDEEAQTLRSQIESVEDDLEVDDEATRVLKGRIEDAEMEVRNLHRLIESNQVRAENAGREIDKIDRTKQSLLERVSILEKDLLLSEESLKASEEKLGREKSGLDGEIRRKHDAEVLLAQAYKVVKDMSTVRDVAREKYHETRARLQSLEELFSGVTQAAETFHALKEKSADTCSETLGFLGDLFALESSSSELPPRVVMAVERWVERLLIDRFDTLPKLASALQKFQLGSLPVFLLAQDIDEAQIKDWAEKFELENLAEHLLFDRDNERLALLSRCLYYSSALALDIEALKTLPHGAVLFTASGVYASSRERIDLVGGAQNQGLLSRKTEKENLEKSLKELEAEVAKAQTELDELDLRISSNRQIVAEIDAVLQTQNKDVFAFMSEAQSLRQTLDHKSELLEQVKNQLQELDKTQGQLRQEKQDLAESQDQLNSEKENAAREWEELKADLMSSEELLQERRRQSQSRETDLVRLDAKAQGFRDALKHLKAQLDLAMTKLTRRYEEETQLIAGFDEKKADRKRAEESIAAFIDRRDELSEQIQEKRNAQAGIHEELRVVETRLKEGREAQARIQKLVSDKSVEAERLKLGIESFSSQAQEKYHLDIATFETVIDDKYPVERKGKELQSMRQKLEAMGPVNLMAMQEYEELSKRSEFITIQKSEIHSSIEALNSGILEIETSSKEKFLAIFERVNVEFGQLFPILFPSGEAHLEMTNAEDPLSGGVEIMVRLPGKKQQRMNLFSGGEKALTAISLIFALLKTKPTPFCFLDEVDAPLDEANVGRYNRVLEALSQQFQFIVITHNRRTMEVLDTLYGVTMQEGGVSTVVGVDMKKDLPAHLKKSFKEEKKEERMGASSAL